MDNPLQELKAFTLVNQAADVILQMEGKASTTAKARKHLKKARHHLHLARMELIKA